MTKYNNRCGRGTPSVADYRATSPETGPETGEEF